MGSERRPPIPALLLLNLMHSWENRSFKESRHQMEGFIPFPSHTHPFFIPVPNRPSHLPLTSHYPLSLHSTSTPFFSPSHTLTPSLHLHFTFLPFLISPSFLPSLPLSLFPCHSVFFVHSSFTPLCYSSRPPSSCSPGVCGSDNEAHS